MSDEAPKIQIDDDWKAQAKAEKAKLEEKVKQAEAETKPKSAAAQSGQSGQPQAGGGAGSAAGGARGPQQIPPASFDTLVSEHVSRAFTFLGAIPDPNSGRRIQHLDLARHYIDLLSVIQEKTKGNLTDEEEKRLASTLYELRQAYIQISTASLEQTTQQAAG